MTRLANITDFAINKKPNPNKITWEFNRAAGIRNTIEVEEIIKGTSGNKTVDVITEDDFSGNIVVEGPAKFQKGERSLLFLNREKLYAGEYTTRGGEQGKFPVNSVRLVKSKQMASGEYWPVNATVYRKFRGRD